MSLTLEQRTVRESRITASFLPYLMAGAEQIERIMREFWRIIGDPRYQPDGFEDSWLSHYGHHMEGFCLDWHEAKTGKKFTGRGESVIHPDRPFFSCTLDARDNEAVWDVKTMNGFIDLEERVAWYTPQVVGQMGCAKVDRGFLLVCQGGNEPQAIEVFTTAEYRARVWQQIDLFEECLNELRPPFEFELPRVVPPEKFRTIKLDELIGTEHDPNWSADMLAALATWDRTEPVAKEFDAAKEAVKKVLPDDCGKLFTGQLIVSRDRRNAVRIARAKESK